MGNAKSRRLRDVDGPKHSQLLINGAHFGKIYSVHLHEDESGDLTIMSASQDGKLIRWHIPVKDIQKLIRSPTLSKSNGSKNKAQAIPLRSAWVMTVAMSPSGKLISSGGLDNLLSIHRSSTNEEFGWDNSNPYRELQIAEGYIGCCTWLDEDTIAYGAGDSKVYIWNVPENKHLKTIQKATADVMSVSNTKIPGTDDMQLLAFGSVDNKVYIIAVPYPLKPKEESMDIDDSKENWDNFDNFCITLEDATMDLNSVAFSPDGRFLATAGDDGQYRIYLRYQDLSNPCRSNFQLMYTDEVMVHEPAGLVCVDWPSNNRMVAIADGGEKAMRFLECVNMGEDPMCVKALEEGLRGSSYAQGFQGSLVSEVAKLILDYVGWTFTPYQQKGHTDERISCVKALPNFTAAPGIFVVGSWDRSLCIYVPCNDDVSNEFRT